MNVLLLIKSVLSSSSKLTHFLGCLIDDDSVKFENFNCWLCSQYFHVISFSFSVIDPEVKSHAGNMSNLTKNLVWIKGIKSAVVFVWTAYLGL